MKHADRRFVRRPIMFGCYCLQYLDKSLLNYASVMGILEDADLTTEQYGTLSLIFYVAFLAFEMPHAYCLVRKIPSIYIEMGHN